MYYTFNQLDEYISLFDIKKYKLVSKKKIKYYNIASSFDIEVTSCYKDLETNEIIDVETITKLKESTVNFNDERYKKIAFMYIFMLSIDDKIIIGRKWNELKIILARIKEKFKLDENKRLIIYIHNLSYEFQFIRKKLEWLKIFASEERKIIYADSKWGYTFKCSYFLSNTSLEVIGKNLHKYKAEKQVGLLDYNKIRNSKTYLSDDEIKYCIYDVIVLSNYIKEKIEEEKSIVKIPLTATGYVRRYCKRECNKGYSRMYLNTLFKEMKLDAKLYEHLKRAFQGGYTHSNAINTDVVCENVTSFDFTSSYPAVLLLERYPMSRPYPYKVKSIKDFKEKIANYCCLFDIEFINIRLKEDETNSIISKSKCFHLENAVEDNGRIASANSLAITINEVDFVSISKFYTWDKIKIGYFRIYKKGYLPKVLLECILKFYSDKTLLKGVKDKEREYMTSKGMLNSIFGMMVTDIVRDNIDYIDNDYLRIPKDINEAIDYYNNNKTRFLSYEWGVWCTSYARYNLYDGMKELKNDFIYADTDSLKFFNYLKHADYFINYNKKIDKKINLVVNKYKLDINLFKPKTIDGVEKVIGYWDMDFKAKKFKTLGAKRYLYLDDNNEYVLTVSGLNKKIALPFLIDKAKMLDVDVFDLFNDDLYVDGFHSGKLLHTYIDIKETEKIKDYQGNVEIMTEDSSIHLEPSSYTMSLSRLYLDYIKNIKYEYSKDF